MKNSILAIIAFAVLAFEGCNKTDAFSPADVEARGYGILNFTAVIEGDAVSKASDVIEQGREAAISSVDVFCFDSDGKIVRYLSNGISRTGNFSVPAGVYSVYAVINGPAAASLAKTKADLEAVTTSLGSDNGTTTDFIMVGSNSVTVTAGLSSDVTIEANRIAGRVKLVSITNNCNPSQGALTVKAVFLSNVYNTQNLACSEIQSIGNANLNWSNPYGRPRSNFTEAGKLTDHSSADDADLTFRPMSQSIPVNETNTAVSSFFYAYPNLQSGNAAFSTVYTMSRTRLVVYAGLNGADYYYPVVLDGGIARNTSYDVSVVISGEGTDDPQGKIERNSVKVTVEPKPWNSGASYNESL